MLIEQSVGKFLINAHMVPLIKNQHNTRQQQVQFEFIFNKELELLESMQLVIATPITNYKIEPIADVTTLSKNLFELNHVRVNPKLDNCEILSMLSSTLSNIGVRINNPPSKDSLALCFQPLGEIKDPVRFYFKENQKIVFLCTNKPKFNLICN